MEEDEEKPKNLNDFKSFCRNLLAAEMSGIYDESMKGMFSDLELSDLIKEQEDEG